MSDSINQPTHYTYGKIECIVIEDWGLDYHGVGSERTVLAQELETKMKGATE